MESSDLTGAILDGRYQVLEPVAEGAMGRVYRAERLKLGRVVAIKVLHDSLPDELSSRKRFEIEAMAMAKLEHPHCAAVLDVGIHAGKPFVVMDFVSGADLKTVLAGGPMPVARATEIMRQLLSGVAHAHELGIIHRDIKPANIILGQKAGLGDHVKILDFGLARLGLANGSSLTTGIVVGTPAYMAPEQIRGDEIDGRADVYACGVVFFELLTGKKPYHSAKDDPIEVCKLHLSEPIPRLADRMPGAELAAFEAVVAKALAKSPDDRYASAGALAEAIDAAARTVITPRRLPTAAPPARDESLSIPIESGTAGVIEPRAVPPPAVPPPASPLSRSLDVATTALPAPSPPAGPPSQTTRLGIAVAPAPPSRASGSRIEPVPWVTRRQLALGAGAAALVIVVIVMVASRGGAQPAATADAGVAVGSSHAAGADPAGDVAARANALIASGDNAGALDVVTGARRVYPGSAQLAYVAGRLYFAKLWWTDGIHSFRDAIRLDPAYRGDAELIKIALRGFITTPSFNPELAAFLHDDIGRPVVPYLDETARDHPSPAIRARAAAALRRFH